MKNFSIKIELLPHQKQAVEKLKPLRVGALFMDMGTGKTLTAIELIRLRSSKIDNVVWFAPAAFVINIKKEILKSTDINEDDIECIYGGNLSIKGDKCISIIGLDSLSQSDRVAGEAYEIVNDKSYIVVDESSYIKNYFSLRTKRLLALTKKTSYRLLLTGTPVTQGAVDLFSQMYFLSPSILGFNSFFAFANQHLVYREIVLGDGSVKRTSEVAQEINPEELADKIAPFAHQARIEECVYLPPKTFSSHYIELSNYQRTLYEQAKLDTLQIIDEMPDDQDFMPEYFKLQTELQKICSGFISLDEKQLSEFNRLNCLIDIIDKHNDDKVIIWSKYVPPTNYIKKILIARYGGKSAITYTGKLKVCEREAQLNKWRDPAGARFLIATHSIGGFSLTLNEAKLMIFYDNMYSYDKRMQPLRRNYRIDQDSETKVIDIVADNTIDEKIMTAIQTKEDYANTFNQRITSKKEFKNAVRDL